MSQPRLRWSIGLVLLCVAPSAACQIPVFRYALERWEPDAYLAIIVHDGPLGDSEGQALELLRSLAADDDAPLNLEIQTIDWSQQSAPAKDRLKGWTTENSPLPMIVLRYPVSVGLSNPAWTGALTANNVKRLVQSPLRREISQRLLDGQSAVWIFLDSADAGKNERAYQTLSKELSAVQTQMQLPPQEELEQDEFYRPDTKVELRLEFSVVRLKQDALDESVFSSVLRNSEEGLSELDEPMAIPVFGRGRTYFALVGAGIQRETIEDNCRFLIGACSCQVKAQNPGVDLPFAVPWSREVTNSAMKPVVLPELTGLGGLTLLSEQEEQAERQRSTPEPVTQPAVSPPVNHGQLTASGGSHTALAEAEGHGSSSDLSHSASDGRRASDSVHTLFYALLALVGGMMLVIAIASLWIRQKSTF